MKKIAFTFLLLTVLFGACKSKKPEVYFLDQRIRVEKKMKKLLEASVLEELGIDSAGQQVLREFYKARRFKPVWSNKKQFTEKGKNIRELLKSPVAFGLPSKRYADLKWSPKYHLKNEVIMSCILSRMQMDLKHGLLDSTRKQLKPLMYGDLKTVEKLEDLSSDFLKAAEQIISWGSQDSTYQALAHGLFTFATTHPLDDVKIDVPVQKKDSAASVGQAKKALVAKDYLKAQFSETEYQEALKKFQQENGQKPDAVVGENTAKALEETNIHKCKRVALAMEKWRWKSAFPDKFIWVNIPEFKLRFFINDSLKSENNVIVGKFENQTPEFYAKLRTIVAYPYWNVPYSITSKEILPDAKRSASYFARNKMRIYRKGEEIDPYSVNWKAIREKTFPYSVKQDPGPHNSLGIIKFEFNNPYGVYVHDTPTKSLFKTTVRSYSHGCVRCENPVDLAKLVLLRDENIMTPDSLDTILARQTNFPIQLKKTIPIYFDYISVIPNGKDKVIFLKDIYLRDDEYLKVMF